MDWEQEWNRTHGVLRRKIFAHGAYIVFFRDGGDILWYLVNGTS